MPKRAMDVTSPPRAFHCPECVHEEPTPELLGAHLERHREVEAAGRNSKPCGRWCGRNFRAGANYERKNHEKVCNGEPPLKVEPEEKAIERKEATMSKFPCAYCLKPLKSARSAGQHLRYCEKAKAERGSGVQKPSAAAAAEQVEPTKEVELSTTEQTIVFLRQIETHYQTKLDEVHRLIVAVKGTESKS